MIRPVILSGGGGTRLWPLSRPGNPKQFHRLFGDRSLLQMTVQRCRGAPFLAPVVSTGDDQLHMVTAQLEEIEITPEAVIVEPEARNTAPAIAAAALWALERGDDDPLLVMPSDHVIRDVDGFRSAVDVAVASAMEGKLVTFGIHPTHPHCGYGYIHAPDDRGGGAVRNVRIFVEKPDLATAEHFVAQGDYYWNSGIFLFRPSAFMRELERYASSVSDPLKQAMEHVSTEGLCARPDAKAFARSEAISVDYAVMERSGEVQVVPANFGWSDVGSWTALRDHLPADARGNVIAGDVVSADVTNSLIRNDTTMTVALVGVENMLCVVTDEAVFVAPLDRADEVRQIVEALRNWQKDRDAR